MEELLSLLGKLGASGLVPEMFRAVVAASAAILYGSWKEVWVWNRDVAKLTASYEKLLSKEREEKEWWRSIALRVTGLAETQGKAAVVLAQKTTEAP